MAKDGTSKQDRTINLKAAVPSSINKTYHYQGEYNYISEECTNVKALLRMISFAICYKNALMITNAVEIHLSGRWLFGSPIIRIGLFLRGKLSRILQFLLASK